MMIINEDPFEGHEVYAQSIEDDAKERVEEAKRYKKRTSGFGLTTKQILLITSTMIVVFAFALSITKVIAS